MSGRKLGHPVPGFTPPPRPNAAVLEGRYSRLERLGPRHAEGLFAAYAGHDALWDYMPTGPFQSAEDYAGWVASVETSIDPFFYAIIDREAGALGGAASFLRIKPEAGSIEVGFIALAPQLQQTRAATEAMALMMGWAFDAGYRRYEWKCDALNTPSRRAAARLGLSYEGVFRQATVVKGRNRDTAWFAAIDAEWPELRAAFESWLTPENFDANGRQITALSRLTAPCLVAQDPGA
ncbi:MAG: GNAT family protein [Pseudomonadota bacterium]